MDLYHFQRHYYDKKAIHYSVDWHQYKYILPINTQPKLVIGSGCQIENMTHLTLPQGFLLPLQNHRTMSIGPPNPSSILTYKQVG